MVLGDDLGITKVRGKWFQKSIGYMIQPLYIMPLFHPSFLLRNACDGDSFIVTISEA